MDFFSVAQMPHQRSDNWTCDSAIGLFSPIEGVEPLCFDSSGDLVNAEPRDLFVAPFTAASGIGEFTMPTAEDAASLPPGFGRDDQSWYRPNQTYVSLDSTTSHSASWSDEPSKSTSSQSSAQSCSPNSSTEHSLSSEIGPEEFRIPRTSEGPSSPSKSRKKRNFSHDANGSSTSQVRSAAKRAAHNVIEKRYRTNMNAKFLALESVVLPAGAESQISKHGAGPLKKSQILNSTLAYIERIQQEKQTLQNDLALLKHNFLASKAWLLNRQSVSELDE